MLPGVFLLWIGKREFPVRRLSQRSVLYRVYIPRPAREPLCMYISRFLRHPRVLENPVLPRRYTFSPFSSELLPSSHLRRPAHPLAPAFFAGRTRNNNYLVTRSPRFPVKTPEYRMGKYRMREPVKIQEAEWNWNCCVEHWPRFLRSIPMRERKTGSQLTRNAHGLAPKIFEARQDQTIRGKNWSSYNRVSRFSYSVDPPLRCVITPPPPPLFCDPFRLAEFRARNPVVNFISRKPIAFCARRNFD